MTPSWTTPRTTADGAEPHLWRHPRIALVSTYPPRQCGIATFAHDLRDAMGEVAPDLETVVCAVDRDGNSPYSTGRVKNLRSFAMLRNGLGSAEDTKLPRAYRLRTPGL